MTRAKDLEQDGSPHDTETTPAEDRARVRQARESVQDAIGKIIGEQPDGDADVPDGDVPDADVGSGDRVDVRKPGYPPAKRGQRSDENGAD
ncbi:hypothetical protein EQZ23_11150 [Sphingomonas sp. UV9]|uniref:hypothetical protein n=1 Tax=Sphingomonas sp. UV9 TaxID=1851410 RepID=UPI000FFB4575|nr:hypothetical protein [Sphingomonas sp. UV9]RXD05602.1 hypothetical protein EQZ23_11150 [Sphingomonas sp. UV9]